MNEQVTETKPNLPQCQSCGSPHLQPAGTCSVCLNCGETTGCG